MRDSLAEKSMNALAPLDMVERLSPDEMIHAKHDFIEVCLATLEQYVDSPFLERISVDMHTPYFRTGSHICLKTEHDDGSSVRIVLSSITIRATVIYEVLIIASDGDERMKNTYDTDSITPSVTCEESYYNIGEIHQDLIPVDESYFVDASATQLSSSEYRHVSPREVAALTGLLQNAEPEEYWFAPKPT